MLHTCKKLCIHVLCTRFHSVGHSSYVVGQVMPFLIHKSQHFNYLTKINVFLDQIAHISVYDKARIVHESSLKSSVSAFSGGLTSFQNSMISTPIKIQFGQCPPCNSFARKYRHLIFAADIYHHILRTM